ncbi:hypothetical protein [Serratia marcescens]|uniref:hypothetical protein n=1 Tax=Serratia marcescens TaxID=615 RepID=UPI001CEFB05E|nr:hypothetical protein [Serratia marcescens]
MHRIDTPTAQIDKFGPGKNGFTNGDPATGRRATDLNSDMWDAVQEEMANAIEGNGIALDKSKHNQLYLAIQKAITDPGFLKKVNNLSDLANVAEARGNLQLGTAATKNVGTEGGNVMAVGAFGLGSGSRHRDDAYCNQGEIYRVNNTSANSPTTGVAGIISLPCDGGPSTAYAAVSNAGAMWSGYSNIPANGIKWSRVYTTAYKPTAADVGLGNVGNFMAVQQGGATGMLENKVYIGWSSNKGLIGHVDSTPLGSIYCEQHKPTASDVGAYPITGGNLQGALNALGSVGTQGGAFIIRNAQGVQIASVSAGNNGSISVYSDVTGRSFGIDGGGNFTTSSGALVCELGQRVYSPNNPQPAVQLNQDNIGSLAFARLNPQNTSTGYGGFVSGGDLSPAGVTGYPGGGNWAAIYAQGTTLPGTWKCLGQCISDTEGSNRHFGASLFVRVS